MDNWFKNIFFSLIRISLFIFETEFSDPIIGNRWKRDEIDLTVAGRNCPYPVNSQHDRR